MDRYIATAIQGDLRPALSWFDPAASADDAAARDLASRFEARFVARSEPLSPASGDDLVDAVVAAYRAYWLRGLLGEMPEPDNLVLLEQALSRQLQARIDAGEPARRAASLDERVATALHGRGFHVLLAPAPPLRDLLVWRTQHSADYEVELVDGRRAVQVHFMTDFASLGWKDYAALGLAATSGWVEHGELFCVAGTYDLASEAFTVSYLKHESRHLADFERFPGLPAADLEYRAKLTELSFAAATLQRLLTDFTLKSANNPDSPHAQANHRVVHDLYRELFGGVFPGGADIWYMAHRQRVNQAARRLLERDTVRLERHTMLNPETGSRPTGR